MNRLSIVFLALVSVVPSARPQASTSSVSGTVRDQSGGAIPNANVTLENIGTNVSLTTRTNESGLYFFPGTIAGSYRVSVTSPGMDRFVGGFTVRAAENLVLDPVLKPGSPTTSVEVTDISPLLVVENAVVTNTVEHVRIEQLPVNG